MRTLPMQKTIKENCLVCKKPKDKVWRWSSGMCVLWNSSQCWGALCLMHGMYVYPCWDMGQVSLLYRQGIEAHEIRWWWYSGCSIRHAKYLVVVFVVAVCELLISLGNGHWALGRNEVCVLCLCPAAFTYGLGCVLEGWRWDVGAVEVLGAP